MSISRIYLQTRICFILALGWMLSGCNSKPPQPSATTQSATRQTDTKAAKAVAPISIQFADITAAAGIKFKHTSGAFGSSLQPETMGSGVAFIDYNGDGYQDIFFVNSRNWTDAEVKSWQKGKWRDKEIRDFQRFHPPGTPLVRYVPANRDRRRTMGALYRNNRNGTFSDVTRGSGLDIEMYGMGVAVGDYDNDGKPDLNVTSLGRNFLFRNQSTLSAPRFRDVATQAGMKNEDWGSSSAWVDYDKDGRLDLFLCCFLRWTPATDIYGSADGRHKGYVKPTVFKGFSCRLFRNVGGGRFKDVSAQAGVEMESKGLAVTVCDYNDDKWPDILVANDTFRNFLFRNNKNGTFSEVAQQAGIAYSNEGMERAGMGLDTADIDHSNRDSVVIANFASEMVGLYHNQGNGSFVDIAPQLEVGAASEKFLSWGVSFSDVNNDGWPDLFVANGHINDAYNIGTEGVTQAQRPLLFLNDGRGLFNEIGIQSGEAMKKPIIARGLACADIDLDGDVDVVLSTNGGSPMLLRNDGSHKNHSIRLVLRGTKSNRSGIGTLVKVKLSEQDGLRRWVRSGSSYLSQSELPLTLGVGKYRKVLLLTLYWPSGKVTRLHNVTTNQLLIMDETKGLISRHALTH